MGRMPPESIAKALDRYKDVPLSDEEITAALLDALMRKDRKLEQDRSEELARKNRALFTQKSWTMDQTRSFIKYRMAKLTKRFVVDEKNEAIMEVLAAYFSEDPSFVNLATASGVLGADLDKGILLAGTVGIGKTTIMQLFSKNHRRVYKVISAADIARNFVAMGAQYIETMSNKEVLPVNDYDNLYQDFAGVCIDDAGSEMIKNNYGNKANVIAEIIEGRYFTKSMGDWFHMTTNLTMDQIEEYYGIRVRSRLRERVNLIEMKGQDRRK